MNAPLTSVTSTPLESSEIGAAIVVDQLELFRLGLRTVLEELGINVVAQAVRAVDGYRLAHTERAELVIVGKTADLKKKQPLIDAKKKNPQLKVMMLLDQAQMQDVALLVGYGIDALLLRSAKGNEIADAIHRLDNGERVVASALAVGTLGRVGPVDADLSEAPERSGLSPKELEVLAELATGASYKEIAEAMTVSQATVKTHLVHIYAKLEVKNRNQAVSRALALGLLG
jgi:DNA-binding NarL/FixJ family response regulator